MLAEQSIYSEANWNRHKLLLTGNMNKLILLVYR